MKGLLVKDFCLLKNNKRFYIVLPFLAILFAVTNQNLSFVISFLTLVFTMITLTTISYDEFDKSSAFLFIMPISRKQYVAEKYVFGVLCSIAGCFLALVINSVVGGFILKYSMNPEILIISAATLYIAFLILLFSIPVQLKFGSDNGKIAIMAIVAVTIVIIIGIGNLAGSLSLQPGIVLDVMDFLIHWPLLLAVLFLLANLLLLWISYSCSVHIVKKKQF